MRKKFIIGILIAITSIIYISAVFGMVCNNNGMNKAYLNMNQISSYNNNHNNMMTNGFYTSSLYANHRNNLNYMGNSFSNNMMENNFNHMRYRNFRMM